MEHATSTQILVAAMLAVFGFVFRLGVAYEQNKKKMLRFWEVFFMFMFSMGASALMFIWIIERDFSQGVKHVVICLASFFGSVMIRGFGNIKGEWFEEVFKDIARKWLNVKKDDYGNTIQEPGGEGSIREAMREDEEGGGDLGQ